MVLGLRNQRFKSWSIDNAVATSYRLRLEAERQCREVYYLLGPSCLTKITCYR